MPVEFRSIEVHSTWRNFPRHPAGADHADWNAKLAKRVQDGIEKFGIMQRPVVLKRESDGMFVLDGWQMYQACIVVDVQPPFVELVGGIEPEDFVEIKNDFRRHETLADMRKRCKARSKKIKEDVVNGKPIKEAAADAGISLTQAYRDVKPIRCEKCAELDATGDDCITCQLLRMDDGEPEDETPPKPDTHEPPEENDEKPAPPPAPAMDAIFVTIPEHALDAWRVAGELAHICHEVDSIAKRLARIIAEKVGSRYISPTAAIRFADLREHVWQARATYVCPYCQGHVKEDCHCRGQGWVSKTAFAQAPPEMQNEMRRIGARNVPI